MRCSGRALQSPDIGGGERIRGTGWAAAPLMKSKGSNFERTFASFSDVVVDNLHDLDRIFVMLLQPLTMVLARHAVELDIPAQEPGRYDEGFCTAGSGLLGHQAMTPRTQTRGYLVLQHAATIQSSALQASDQWAKLASEPVPTGAAALCG